MMLWRRDVSLQLIGGLLIIFVWAALIANRLQGNLIELYFRSMSNTKNYPLWWLDSLFCMLCWSVPLGMFSFIWHTLKLIQKELRGW
jgi:hypothetical protein